MSAATRTRPETARDPGMIIPWTGQWETFARPGVGGLPEFRYRSVPARLGLATRRQLRALHRTPGPQPVCARINFRRKGVGWCYADLYRIDLSIPQRPQTPARHAGWEAAMRGRRTCHVDGHLGPRDVGYCVPWASLGGCRDCWSAGRCTGTLGPAEHDTPLDPEPHWDPWAEPARPADPAAA